MIEVLPLRDKILQKSACIHCGVKYSPELLAYAAYDNGNIACICQFSINDERAYITDLTNATTEANRSDVLFITARAALNFIDLCGVRFSEIKSKNIDDALAQRIGFSKKSDGIYEIDLSHLF